MPDAISVKQSLHMVPTEQRVQPFPIKAMNLGVGTINQKDMRTLGLAEPICSCRGNVYREFCFELCSLAFGSFCGWAEAEKARCVVECVTIVIVNQGSPGFKANMHCSMVCFLSLAGAFDGWQGGTDCDCACPTVEKRALSLLQKLTLEVN